MNHCLRSHRRRLTRFFLILCFATLVTGVIEAQNRGNRAPRIDLGEILAAQMLAQGDKNADQILTRQEFLDLAPLWFSKLSGGETGIGPRQITQRFSSIVPPTNPPAGEQRRPRQTLAFLAGQGLFQAADQDKNGSVTAAEFENTFQKWFAAWDPDGSGRLEPSAIAAGLNVAMPRPRRRGFGPRTPQADDATGFRKIFDGETLAGWEGDPRFWRAENGEIIGESSESKRVEQNTFLIWRDGTTRNFEFKLEFKISDGANSGVQYRSSILAERGQWAMKGYQADMDSSNRFTGMIYEERGRGFLAPRGQFARIVGANQTKLIGSVGESDALKAVIKQGDWNQLHIVARDNVIVQSINGHVMSGLVDDDPDGRRMEGLLGLQIHTGPPMKLQFRNLLFKEIQ